MSLNIFVNFTTDDLDRSKAFYEALGYSINPMFTDDNAACVVLSDTIYFMVQTREFYATFTDKQIIDPHTQAGASVALSQDSREAVDAIVARGLEAGGSEPRPAQDYGFMYSRDLEDPDGNLLSFLFMEPAAVEKGPEAFMTEQGAGAQATA
ncbi:VOC family protein [Leifsonia virtsii]|uniref:Glyoxalase n=1 Tax=Leifsonia virtsii TaxID=3035915 RepID=A0ABT8IZE9_9MICO|nr:VOC family protein [Leifsonia virtsii]MDN4598205.1 glyoxalase [Leifsonia virtsii]